MRVAGICHVCGKPSMTACSNCGMITCQDCTDNMTGLCPNCSPAEFVIGDGEDDDDVI